jgi:hypothetical protein
MKRLLLLLLFPLAFLGQTSNTGSSISGSFVNRPACSRNVSDSNAHNGDVYSDTDDGNVYKCSGGAWWPVGRRTSPAISPNPAVFDLDMIHPASNIYVDIRAYGAYATFSSTTCNTTNGSPRVRLGAASNFKNGEYATCYNAGPSPTVSTPSAPTVTPSDHAGGMTAVNDSGGTTSYAYEIVAEDKNNGRSAASAPGTTSTGATNLGQTAIYNFSGCTRGSHTVTCTTTATHNFVVGQLVITQNMTDTSFNGNWITISPTSGTTVTFLSGWDTRNGAGTRTTPSTTGNVYGFKMNRVSYTAVTNAFRYHIYGPNCPTTCNWLGQSVLPYWDDYGSTMRGNQSRPAYIPTTAPSSAANEHFTFKILSGAGTATLTANTNAGASITSNIVSDVGPAIVNAAAAARTVAGNQVSCVMIPNAYVGGSTAWQINSHTDLTSYTACIEINGTALVANNTLAGAYKLWGVGSGGGIPNFGAENLAVITGTGFPLVFNSTSGGLGPSIRDLSINTSASNGGLGVYLNTPTNMTWRDVYLGSGNGSSSDCIGMPVLINNTATGFTLNIEGFGMITGTCPTGSPVPAFVDMATGSGAGSSISFSNGWLLNRGSIDNDLSAQCLAGYSVGISNVSMQNASEPGLQISGTCYNLGGTLSLNGFGEADFSTPLVAVYTYGGGRWPGGIVATGMGPPNGGVNTFTGTPVSSLILSGSPLNASGSNSQMVNQVYSSFLYDGSYNGPAETQQNQDFALGKGYPLFTSTGTPAAPTCTTISGGPPYPASGSYTFQYAPQFPNGGTGVVSRVSNSCTVNGTSQQITVTIPSAIPSAVSYQLWLGGTGSLAKMNGTCSVDPQYVGTLTGTYTGGNCGGLSLPTLPGGGPAGIVNGNMWAQDFILGATPAPTGVANSTQLYMDSTRLWPSFKPNGNKAYVVPGISGPLIHGHNLCADGTSGAYVDCLTTQTIASGTATLGTTAIAGKACATVVTTAATGVVTTDAISYSFNAAPSGAYTTGLFVQSYVTPGNVNFLVCNPTTESLSPPGVSLNWRVTR